MPSSKKAYDMANACCRICVLARTVRHYIVARSFFRNNIRRPLRPFLRLLAGILEEYCVLVGVYELILPFFTPYHVLSNHLDRDHIRLIFISVLVFGNLRFRPNVFVCGL